MYSYTLKMILMYVRKSGLDFYTASCLTCSEDVYKLIVEMNGRSNELLFLLLIKESLEGLVTTEALLDPSIS